MPQIPVDQKFHTLNANTPTKDRGSAQTDGLREIYTMQDIIDSVGGGSSFDVLAYSDGGPFSRLVQLDGVDAATGLPIAKTPNISTSIFGDLVCGVLSPDAVRFERSEVFVSGKIAGLTFLTPPGGGAVVGDIVYAGYGFFLTWGGGRSFDENIPVGRIVNTPTLVNTYSDYDLYEATLILTLPENTAYYLDTVSLNDSIRNHYTKYPAITVTDFNIVKSESDIQISRWDPSAGDTPEQILGVTTQGFTPAGSLDTISACLEGIMRIPETSIGGAQPTVGVSIYSDATTPYLLTTDATSGVKIGRVVKRISRTDSSGTVIAYSFLQVGGGNIGGGGGGVSSLENLTGDVSLTAGYGMSITDNGSDTITIGTDLYGLFGYDWEFSVSQNQLSTVGTYEGTVIYMNPGGSVSNSAAQVQVLSSGAWSVSSATSVAAASGFLVIGTNINNGRLTNGIMYMGAGAAPGSPGDVLYLSTTSGELTATAPSAAGNIVRVMGYNLDGDRIYFNPSADWIEI